MIHVRHHVFLLLLFFNSTLMAGNIVLNPSFEIAGPDGPTSSLYWETLLPSVDGAVNARSSLMASDGDWSHHLSTMGTNNNGGTALLLYSQLMTGQPSLAESQNIFVSFDVSYFETSGLTGGASFSILGPNVGIVETTNVNFPRNTDFTSIQTTELTVPMFGSSFPNDDSYFIQIEFRVSSTPSAEYAEAFIDNVQVEAVLVPETSSFIMAIAAMFFMLFARCYR